MNNYILYLLLFIFSYLMGSIPFAYIITKLSSKKNILEIGWRKSSGSNVMKNVGKWQGLLTAFLDIGKGFLPVYLAKYYFDAPETVQVICCVFTVIGHNWSIFLGFSGGRGLAALMGGLLIFNYKLLLIGALLTLFFAIMWTASVGTILALLLIMFFSFKPWGFEPAGLAVLISLIPIFIKRLSPIKEILTEDDKEKQKELIENRLIFDQDTIPPYRRRLFKKKEKPL